MNFANNTFETSLDLYHMQLGESQFSAFGRIFDGGYFHFRDGQSRIVGASSLDGSESGYFLISLTGRVLFGESPCGMQSNGRRYEI